ncbi:MAG: hypothetical protein IPL41_03170 [Micropruina sp.]|nr:hypothetical protein [Micropruina sp.]
MKRPLSLLPVLLVLPLLLMLGACTLGQPAPTATSASPDPTPAATASESPSPTPSENISGTPAPSVSSSYDPSASPSGSISGTASPTATETGSAGSFRAPGEVLDLNGEVTVTVLDSKRAKVAGHRGNQVLVMVKSCNVAAAQGIELTWDSWVLLGPDSEEYPPSAVRGPNEPAPVFPNASGRLYKPGQCAKGWVVFDVPAGSVLSGVRYMNSQGDSAQWRLSASV